MIKLTKKCLYKLLTLMICLSTIGFIYFKINSETMYSSSPKSEYVVSEIDGFICIYSCDDLSNPAVILDVKIDYLPENDRITLKEGIAVTNNSKLRQLIEDFTG